MLELMGELLQPGIGFGEKYRLERPLGAGGMGAVWAAVDRESGANVALKVLHAERVGDAKDRARFVREAKLAMAVRHANVASVHAVGETESGTPYLVMDLLEGESLRTLLQRRSVLQPEECARIFAGILAGVRAAHTLGIIHRDLKPENVFLVNEPGASSAEPRASQVRVLDFGVAKRMPSTIDTTTASASLTSTGAVVGTPRYMAPEQIFGAADLDARADVWALGVMLFEALAGERPTEGSGFGEILRRVTVDPLPTLRSVRPGLPRALDLVDRMLARPREQRPSLDAVAAMLARIEDGDDEPAPATLKLGEARGRTAPLHPPLPPPDNTTRPVAAIAVPAPDVAPARIAALGPRRRPSFLVFGSLAVLLVFAGGFAFGGLGRRPSLQLAFSGAPGRVRMLTISAASASAKSKWPVSPTRGRLKDVTFERTLERLGAAGWEQSTSTKGEPEKLGQDTFYRGALFFRGETSLSVRFYLAGTDGSVEYWSGKAKEVRDEIFIVDPPLFLAATAHALGGNTHDPKETERALEIILRESP